MFFADILASLINNTVDETNIHPNQRIKKKIFLFPASQWERSMKDERVEWQL